MWPWLIFLFPLFVQRLKFDVVFINSSFVAVTTLFKNSSLPSEVFQPMQRSFCHNFCGVSSSGNILAQAFIISQFLLKIWWTGDFPQPSASAIILTVIRRSLSTREHTRSMLPPWHEVEGVLILHRPWRLHSLTENTTPTWTQSFLSFRTYFP